MAGEEKRDRIRRLSCRVIADHQASFSCALVFYAGDRLDVEERETAWEGWIWCVNREGTGAWVPDSFVERRGCHCIALRGYDSRELSVGRGDILEASEEVGGWSWCSDSDGNRGWVPAACVEPLESDGTTCGEGSDA